MSFEEVRKLTHKRKSIGQANQFWWWVINQISSLHMAEPKYIPVSWIITSGRKRPPDDTTDNKRQSRRHNEETLNFLFFLFFHTSHRYYDIFIHHLLPRELWTSFIDHIMGSLLLFSRSDDEMIASLPFRPFTLWLFPPSKQIKMTRL